MSFHPLVDRITTEFTNRGFWFESFTHPPVTTSAQASAVRPGFDIHHGAKALIIKYQKTPQPKYAMLVIPGHQRFDPKKVKQILHTDDLSFASVSEVAQITSGILPGGIPPLGHLFSLPVYCDASFSQMEKMVFNAGDRCVSVAMFVKDYLNFVQPQLVDIAL